MNNKIPLNALAAQMAKASGMPESECINFVKSLFQCVAEDLCQGKNVTVPGLGTFSVDSSCQDPIRFVADQTLASEINAPFGFFQSVEIGDNVSVEEVESIDDDEPASFDQTSEPIEEPEPDSKTVEVESCKLPENIEQQVVVELPDCDNSDSPVNAEIADTHSEDGEPTVDDASIDTSDSNDDIVADVDVAESVSEAEIPTETETESDDIEQPQTCLNQEIDIQDEMECDSASNSEMESDSSQCVTMIPEEEEEFVEYYQQARKGRFWIGFIVGLLVGVIIATLVYALYVTNFFNFTI